MSEEKIKLSALLDAFLDFRANAGDVEYYKKAEDLLQKVIVKEKMFLLEKQEAQMEILSFAGMGEPDAVGFAMRKEVGELFFGLFAYGANLDMDVPLEAMTPFAYDTFVTFGISNYFLQFCKEDFEALKGLVDNAVNFSNVLKITEAVKMFTPEAIEETRQSIKEMKEYLTPEKIAEIKALLAAGDPAWQALKETVAESVAENITMKEAVDMADPEENAAEFEEESAKLQEESGEEAESEEDASDGE